MCYSIMVETDLKRLAKDFDAIVDDEAFAQYAVRSGADPKRYKPIAAHARIFPNYFAPLIVAEGKRRVIKPMRYRVLPSWSEKEIPAKYNVFNARLDALESRRTWKNIFMRRHGILVFQA